MNEILQQIELTVCCGQCDRSYEVPLSVIAESQRLLEEGCPGSEFECAATYFAKLVDPTILQRLVSAWEEVEASARLHTDPGRLSARLFMEVSLDSEPRLRTDKPTKERHHGKTKINRTGSNL